MGTQDSATSNLLLDATERVMRNEGYAAATSRRIAEEAGLKQQLVYYYFRSMDELLLAAFTRRTAAAIARIEEETLSDNPTETIWRNWVSTVDSKLVFEFIALANHHEGVREEVNRFMLAARVKHAEAIERQFRDKGVTGGPSPAAIAFFLFTTALMLGREEAMGMTTGHDDVRALVDDYIANLS